MERKKRRLSSIHSTQSFPHRTLPISEYKDHILSVLEKNQVVVCIGETGSGKTTQIPQFLDAAGYTIGGKCIAITQPRRVAAISSAQRVAEEMKCTIGAGPVAYIIRFDDQSTTNTRIKFMTDGILVS
jgi:HrpA-like RNA helicase